VVLATIFADVGKLALMQSIFSPAARRTMLG
jgi:hypothetical protein